MRTWTFERLGALAGLAFIALSLSGDFSSGSPPGTDDSAAKIVGFFSDHHRGVIASVVLTGIAGPFFVWFLATLVLRLRTVGETAWAVAAFGLGIAALVAGFAADAFYGSLARVAVTATRASQRASTSWTASSPSSRSGSRLPQSWPLRSPPGGRCHAGTRS